MRALRLRPWLVLATALLLLGPAPLGCRGGGDARPNLVLVTIDDLRADHVGAYGYDRPTSPTLDRLASEGVLFENVLSTSSWTKPAVASLFTSRTPSEHGAVSLGHHLDGSLPTLASVLAEAGYHTVGVSGNFVHVNSGTGFAHGFAVWRSVSRTTSGPEADDIWEKNEGGRRIGLRAPTAAEVNEEVLDHLPAPEQAPFFLYVHYMDPHAGFTPPDAFRARFVRDPELDARSPRATSDYVVGLAAKGEAVDESERRRLLDLYDAEIASVDAQLGRLLDELARRGLARRTIVAIVSDHGEEFGEHGGWFHGRNLFGESLAVPWIVFDPRSTEKGVRRADRVDLMDVPTTLLGLVGVPPPASMRGRALLGSDAVSARPAERDLVAELHSDPPFEEHVSPRTQRRALVRWPWKAIVEQDRSARIYRLDRDPHERSPLAPEDAELPPGLRERVAALARGVETETAEAPELDADERASLRALGYAE